MPISSSMHCSNISKAQRSVGSCVNPFCQDQSLIFCTSLTTFSPHFASTPYLNTKLFLSNTYNTHKTKDYQALLHIWPATLFPGLAPLSALDAEPCKHVSTHNPFSTAWGPTRQGPLYIVFQLLSAPHSKLHNAFSLLSLKHLPSGQQRYL